jgi:hypothetical protein
VSNTFCPDLATVWLACSRVFAPGGTLLVGFINPDVYLVDAEAMDSRSELVVRHVLAYSDVTQLSADERERACGRTPRWNSANSMSEQIGGQLAAGFVLTGFVQAQHQSNPTAHYMPGYFATRAIKQPPAAHAPT